MQLPYVHELRIKEFSVDILDDLAERPFCFLLDSASNMGGGGRYSFFGADPVRTFSSSGGLISVDNRRLIDDPINALKRFEASLTGLPVDPYLPFSGGLVGFVGHGWPDGLFGKIDLCELPDAWFGLFDTILTIDHLEGSCWINSMGLAKDGKMDPDLAKLKCEGLEAAISKHRGREKEKYIMRPLTPEPVSSFNKDNYIDAINTAKNELGKKEWQRTNIAQRYHAPVAKDAWYIHKMLRQKNPTPYASFLRCGSFEMLSSSPSCFLRVKENQITCNVVQKTAPKDADPKTDKMNAAELLDSSRENDPVVVGDENSLERVTIERPVLRPARLESDARTHYLVSRIEGEKEKRCSVTDCISAAMPASSMTGVPKGPVNSWLKKVEPARRHIYTGSMGYIDTMGNAQFNHAVRTMVVKDSVAFIHSGSQVERKTDAEEVFVYSKKNIEKLFDEIRGLGY